MKYLTVIGNLGADAEARREEGREFLSMSIADTTTKRREDGTTTETTEWISATYNGNHSELLPYLKKGQKIMAIGECATRLFSSKKDRCMKAGINLYIRELRLLGSNPDTVPSRLYDYNGQERPVTKYYWAGPTEEGRLYDRRGQAYDVTPEGWVQTPISAAQNAEDGIVQASSDAVGEHMQASQESEGQQESAPFTPTNDMQLDPDIPQEAPKDKTKRTGK